MTMRMTTMMMIKVLSKMNVLNLRLLLLIMTSLVIFVASAQQQQHDASTCSVDMAYKDPNLREISFDIGYGTEHFEVYIQPNVTRMMRSTTPVTAKTPSFNGLASKFFNLSPETVLLYWDPMTGQEPSLQAKLTPFSTSGTASFPGHNFLITPTGYNYVSNRKVLQRIVVYEGISNYYYDPLDNPNDSEETTLNLATLTLKQYEMYEKMKRTQRFNEEYKKVTGREYLSHYPRQPPTHFMWPAEYFGQTHWVTSPEVHFIQTPNPKDLKSITAHGKKRILKDSEPRFLSQYRDQDKPFINMTLTVLSCAPRALEIQHFLSDTEADHILHLAGVLNLSRSKVGDADNTLDDTSTRTSFNTWVTREQDYVVDAIYRRAADLLRIDEALMRFRGDGEFSDVGTESSIAESLQLVRYRDGQEYTAHHDFGYSEVDEPRQPNRFATILFYLNEGMVGGETEFPRWVNGETHMGLRVTPEKGKAVLFYSHLPDGNMDDLSQHAALPVTQGMKFLTNLWVWDPIYES